MAKYNKDTPNQYDGIIRQSATKNGVSYDLLRNLLFNESSFNSKAKSPTGPKGIAQFTAATGRAMGLNVFDGEDNPNDDRYNPELSIDAAGRHLGEMVRQYDGDELKAALAYNVGGGKKGRPQLEAYDRGEFGLIGTEGRLYMRRLLGSAQSKNKDAVAAYGDFTGKGEVFEGNTPQTVVQPNTVGPQVTGMQINTSDLNVEAKVDNRASFIQELGQTPSEVAADKPGTFTKTSEAVDANIQNSVLGTVYHGAERGGYDIVRDSLTPTKWNTHIFTEEELQKVRDSGLHSNYIQSVLGSNAETLDDMIALAKERQARDETYADAGIGAKLVGGLAGAAVDPVSYIPFVGATERGVSLGVRMARAGTQAAGLNVASEAMRVGVGGGHTDYMMAAGGGLLFGAGMTGLIGKFFPHEAAQFGSPAARAESRDAAMRGMADESRVSTEGMDFQSSPGGTQFADRPDGSIVLADGTVMDVANPLNVRTAERFAEFDPTTTRGSLGVRMGGLTEISLVTARSESEGVRNVAFRLTRSSTGYQGGGNGYAGTVASDTLERLHYGDNRDLAAIHQGIRDALKDAEWSTGGVRASSDLARETVGRRAVEALESGEVTALTAAERQLMDDIGKLTRGKEEAMVNPAMFGDANAVPVMTATRHSGKYFPVVYVPERVAALRGAFGNTVEGAQNFMKGHFLADYKANQSTRDVVDELVMGQHKLKTAAEVTPEMVDKWANDKAFGITNGDYTSSRMLEDIADSSNSMNLGRNDFLESRHGFNMAFESRLPDGTPFTLNDLRSFDVDKILRNYTRRVNGDIAIHSTGQTTDDVMSAIGKLREEARVSNSGNMRKEVTALEDTVKLLTGRSRRNNYSGADMALGALTDMSFLAKNAYMGALNLTEIAGMVAKGNVRGLAHGIPVVRDLMYARKAVTGTELRKLHHEMIGRDVDDVIRPRRQELIQTLRDSANMGNTSSSILGSVKFATQEMAARWPLTKLLNGTTNYLLDASRQGLMGNLIEAAATGRSSRWLKDNFLKSASVTREQADGIMKFLKDHHVPDANGRWTFPNKEAMQMDPRAMDLWRIADKVADESILRPHKLSAQNAKQFGPLMKAVLQFKNFVIKSVNGRFLRTLYMGTKDGRAMDAGLTMGLSGMLAGSFYVMQNHLKASALPINEQEAYLAKANDPSMIAYATFARSSHMGAPLGLLGFATTGTPWDINQYLRSTFLPKEKTTRDPSKKVTGFQAAADVAGAVGQQVPSLGMVGSAAALAQNVFSKMNSRGPAADTEFMTGIYQNIRDMIPNDPLTQRVWLAAMEENINAKAPVQR